MIADCASKITDRRTSREYKSFNPFIAWWPLLFPIGFHLGPVVFIEQIIKIIVEVSVDVLIVGGQVVHHHSCGSAGLKEYNIKIYICI